MTEHYTALLVAFIGLLGALTVWIRSAATQRQEKTKTAQWQTATAEAQATAAQLMALLDDAQQQQLEQASSPSARQESIKRMQARLDDLAREQSETRRDVTYLQGRVNGGK